MNGLFLCNIFLIAFTNKMMCLKSPENENNSNKSEDKIEFIPTREWQEVQPNHILPAGLHIQIDMQSGKKIAKLIDKESKNQPGELSIVNDIEKTTQNNKKLENVKEVEMSVVHSKESKENMMPELLRENLVEALKNIKKENLAEDSKNKTKKFRSYEELKEEMKKYDMNFETDAEIMERLVEKFSTSKNMDEKINVLEDLDYLVHQVDNAVDFATSFGGFQKVIEPGMNSTNTDIKMGALRVLGAASQSNPKVQIAAFESKMVQKLVKLLALESETKISSKVLFALSCIIRGFPIGQKAFVVVGAIPTLKNILLNTHDERLRLKIIDLIYDLLFERKFAEGERLSQLNFVNLESTLVEEGWCSALISILDLATFVDIKNGNEPFSGQINENRASISGQVNENSGLSGQVGENNELSDQVNENSELSGQANENIGLSSNEKFPEYVDSDFVSKVIDVLNILEQECRGEFKNHKLEPLKKMYPQFLPNFVARSREEL